MQVSLLTYQAKADLGSEKVIQRNAYSQSSECVLEVTTGRGRMGITLKLLE